MADSKDEKVSLTFEQLKDLMGHFARELKKPTEEEQAKLDKAKAEFERRQQEMLQVAREEEESDRRRKAACSHRKLDGRWATGGQITSDGKLTLICVACSSTWKIDPTPAMMSGDQAFNGYPPPVVERVQ